MNLIKRLYCLFWGHEYHCNIRHTFRQDGSVVLDELKVSCCYCDYVVFYIKDKEICGTWEEEQLIAEAQKIANGN